MTRDLGHFVRALAVAPARELNTTLVRRVPLLAMAGSAPLDFLFTSGMAFRYNPRGVRCLYFAEDEATVAAEYERHSTGRLQPFVTYFADARLRRVIDLGDAGTMSAFGLSAHDLRTPWAGAPMPTATQLLGLSVSQQTVFSAIRFPSEAARTAGGKGFNVVVFPDAVRRPDFLRILGPTQTPLQQWP